MKRAAYVLLALCSGLVALGVAAPDARAAGYATDDGGRLYRVFPASKRTELLGTVRVSAERGGNTVVETPTLTDIALHDEKGLYGISFTELYKIELRDPGRSTHVGSLGGTFGSFNALEFDDEGRLWALGGSALYRVDVETGKATKIGSFGLTASSSGDLAWVAGTLYATLDASTGCLLAKIDSKTGKATRVGLMQTEAKKPLFSVWGLIWDGRTLWGLTSGGDVVSVDRKTAVVAPRFRVAVRFWGASPMLRM